MKVSDNNNIGRSERVRSIRPILTLVTDENQIFEHFQNEVLRPILKLQNDLFIISFKRSTQFQQALKRIDTTNMINIELGVKKFINSNLSFRNKMFGFILGMMTADEYKVFLAHEAEYSKRIKSMLVKRVFEQIEVVS